MNEDDDPIGLEPTPGGWMVPAYLLFAIALAFSMGLIVGSLV